MGSCPRLRRYACRCSGRGVGAPLVWWFGPERGAEEPGQVCGHGSETSCGWRQASRRSAASGTSCTTADYLVSILCVDLISFSRAWAIRAIELARNGKCILPVGEISWSEVRAKFSSLSVVGFFLVSGSCDSLVSTITSCDADEAIVANYSGGPRIWWKDSLGSNHV
jgi:hypothetical protein